MITEEMKIWMDARQSGVPDRSPEEICSKTNISNQKKILDKITNERERQDHKWGEQNHNDFTWIAVLGEEFGEASQAALQVKYGGKTIEDLKKELVHVAAVAVAFLECIERRKK